MPRTVDTDPAKETEIDGSSSLATASPASPPRRLSAHVIDLWNTQNNACNVANGTAFPPSDPTYRSFLAARLMGLCNSLVLIALGGLVVYVSGDTKWLNPIITPASNSLSANLVDLVIILRWGRRTTPQCRVFWDGALAAGLAVASGFLASYSVSYSVGARPPKEDSHLESVVVGAVIAFSMFTSAGLHFVIAVRGAEQWHLLRQSPNRTAMAV